MTDTVSEDWNNGTGYGPLLWFSNTIVQGQGVEWWGMQVEEGISPTSYIPTNGSPVTRVREQIMYITEKVYLSDKATIYTEHIPEIPAPLGTKSGGFAFVIGERNNGQNYLGIDYDNVAEDGRTQSYFRDGSDTNKGVLIRTNRTFGEIFKQSMSFSSSKSLSSSCNGSDIVTATAPPFVSYFEMANRIVFYGTTVSGIGDIRGCGYIRKIQIYNEIFEDEKLVQMTS